MTSAIVWFRRDLRLADNALVQSLGNAKSILPVYIHAPDEDGDWAPGAASRWWLHHSLAALAESLARRGNPAANAGSGPEDRLRPGASTRMPGGSSRSISCFQRASSLSPKRASKAVREYCPAGQGAVGH